jgi:hypothetical protein
MTRIQEIERNGTAAVKRLRMRKLQNGHPFMINSKDLPGNQCYLEYPNGSMVLVSILKSARDFTVIRKLSNLEKNAIRVRYNLSS